MDAAATCRGWRVHNYAATTIEQRTLLLCRLFVTWADNARAAPSGRGDEAHLGGLPAAPVSACVTKRSGKPLSFRSQHTRLVPVRSMVCKWLTRQNVIGSRIPASELVMPKLERRLAGGDDGGGGRAGAGPSRMWLSRLGLRDRAIMEVLVLDGRAAHGADWFVGMGHGCAQPAR